MIGQLVEIGNREFRERLPADDIAGRARVGDADLIASRTVRTMPQTTATTNVAKAMKQIMSGMVDSLRFPSQAPTWPATRGGAVPAGTPRDQRRAASRDEPPLISFADLIG
jgi:hypothetical protein